MFKIYNLYKKNQLMYYKFNKINSDLDVTGQLNFEPTSFLEINSITINNVK